jgi:hypothetical protein
MRILVVSHQNLEGSLAQKRRAVGRGKSQLTAARPVEGRYTGLHGVKGEFEKGPQTVSLSRLNFFASLPALNHVKGVIKVGVVSFTAFTPNWKALKL